MKPRAREPEPEERENDERWLLTYADMITLLTAVFIMLYSMSVVNIEKFKQWAIAIRSGFNLPLLGNPGRYVIEHSSTPKSEMTHVTPRSTQQIKQAFMQEDQTPQDIGFFEKVNRQLAAFKLEGYVLPVLDQPADASNSYVVVVTDDILFEPGSARLTDGARSKLNTVADALKTLKNYVIVEGYTAHRPSSAGTATNAWMLAAQRSANAIQYLTEQAINPRRFLLCAHGEWDPGRELKKLSLSGNGEWIDVAHDDVRPTDRDKVVISVKYAEFDDSTAAPAGPGQQHP